MKWIGKGKRGAEEGSAAETDHAAGNGQPEQRAARSGPALNGREVEPDRKRGAERESGGEAEKRGTAEGTEAAKEARRRRRQRREIRSFFLRLVFLLVFLYLLFFVFFAVRPMPNEDMKPRISAGDLLLCYRLEKRYYPNDVVILRKDGRDYVARIAALPGDEVDIPEEGGLRINGNTVMEGEIYYPTRSYDSDRVSYPVRLGADEYFLLCDYRNGAKDSRFYGVVKRAELGGKVITILRRSNL